MLRASILRMEIPSDKTQRIHLSEFGSTPHELSHQEPSIEESSWDECTLSVKKVFIMVANIFPWFCIIKVFSCNNVKNNNLKTNVFVQRYFISNVTRLWSLNVVPPQTERKCTHTVFPSFLLRPLLRACSNEQTVLCSPHFWKHPYFSLLLWFI